MILFLLFSTTAHDLTGFKVFCKLHYVKLQLFNPRVFTVFLNLGK